MSKDQRERYTAIAAELIGTMILTSAVLVVGNMFGPGTGPWYTALSAGATLMLLVGIFGHTSGMHVNPAVTIGLWTLQKIDTVKAVMYVSVQFLGGALALTLYNYLTDAKIASSAVSAFDPRMFAAETVGAALFGMGIIAAISQKFEGFMKSFVIGGSLTAGALIASLASSGFLNPAVAVGNNAWGKTVVLAPFVGMVIGMNLYQYVFAPSAKGKSKKK